MFLKSHPGLCLFISQPVSPGGSYCKCGICMTKQKNPTQQVPAPDPIVRSAKNVSTSLPAGGNQRISIVPGRNGSRGGGIADPTGAYDISCAPESLAKVGKRAYLANDRPAIYGRILRVHITQTPLEWRQTAQRSNGAFGKLVHTTPILLEPSPPLKSQYFYTMWWLLLLVPVPLAPRPCLACHKHPLRMPELKFSLWGSKSRKKQWQP